MNVGDKYALHIIKFATKVGGRREYIKGQIRYLRVSPFIQEMDNIDQFILDAVKIKYPKAKSIVSLHTKNQRYPNQIISDITTYKRVKVGLSLYSEKALNIDDNGGAEIKQFILDIDLFYDDMNTIKCFGENLSKKIIVSENEWIEIKSQLNRTYTRFLPFFEI